MSWLSLGLELRTSWAPCPRGEMGTVAAEGWAEFVQALLHEGATSVLVP